jgi:hypothetical protein
MRDFARSRGNVRLADRLESVDTVSVLLPNLHDLAEGALSDDLEKLERVDRQGIGSTGRLKLDVEVKGTRANDGLMPIFSMALWYMESVSAGWKYVYMRGNAYKAIERRAELYPSEQDVGLAHRLMFVYHLLGAQVDRSDDRSPAEHIAASLRQLQYSNL